VGRAHRGGVLAVRRAPDSHRHPVRDLPAGAAIAVHLTSSMTRPIGMLVKATRAIAAGT
jgi:hypothetical protein